MYIIENLIGVALAFAILSVPGAVVGIAYYRSDEHRTRRANRRTHKRYESAAAVI